MDIAKQLSRRVLPSTSTGAFWLAFVACLSGCCLFFGLFRLAGMDRPFSVFGQDGYFELARSLIRGDGFVFAPGGSPVHHRPPLYPLVLTPIALFPDRLLMPAMVLLHSLMIGSVGALIFRLARRFFDLGIARAAFVIFLSNPWLYSNAMSPLTPVLQCLLYTSFIYVVAKEVVPPVADSATPTRSRDLPPWLLIGSIGGLLSLTHGTLIAVLGVSIILLMCLSFRRSDARLMRTTLLTALVSLIVVAPWTYRNWVTFDQLIPVVGGGGAMYVNQYWYWTNDDPLRQADESTAARLNDPSNWRFHGLAGQSLDTELNSEALALIRSRPSVFVKGLVLNATAFYFPSIVEVFRLGERNPGHREKLALTTLHLVLWTLTGLGLWHVRKSKSRRLPSLLLLLFVALYAVWYFPFHTSVAHTMYTFSTMPLLAVLSGLGLVSSYREVWRSGN